MPKVRAELNLRPLQRGDYSRRHRSRALIALVVAFVVLAAIVAGAAIALAPVQLGIPVAAIGVFVIALVIVWLAPSIKRTPTSLLTASFCIVIGAYFIWPRNAFIPITALPVKHPQKILYFLFLGGWLLLLFKSSEIRQRVVSAIGSGKAVFFAFCIMFLFRWASVFWSQEFGYSLFRVFDETLSFFAIYLMTVSCIGSISDVKKVASTLVLVAFVVSLFSLPEAVLHKNLFERFVNLDLIDPTMAQQILSMKYRGGAFRAQSSFDHPLLFAEYLAICLPFAASLLFLVDKKRLVGAIVVGAILAGLVVARTRSSFVAVILVSGAMATLVILRSAASAQRNPWPLVLTIFSVPVLMVVASIAFTEVGGAIVGRSHEEFTSSYARVQMLQMGLPLVFESPLVGYGPGLAAVVLGFRTPGDVITLDNYLLAAALDSGVVFLLAFVMIGVFAGLSAIKMAMTGSKVEAELAMAIVGGLVGFYCFKVILGTPLNNLLLFVLVGLAVSLRRLHVQEISNRSGPVRPPG